MLISEALLLRQLSLPQINDINHGEGNSRLSLPKHIHEVWLGLRTEHKRRLFEEYALRRHIESWQRQNYCDIHGLLGTISAESIIEAMIAVKTCEIVKEDRPEDRAHVEIIMGIGQSGQSREALVEVESWWSYCEEPVSNFIRYGRKINPRTLGNTLSSRPRFFLPGLEYLQKLQNAGMYEIFLPNEMPTYEQFYTIMGADTSISCI